MKPNDKGSFLISAFKRSLLYSLVLAALFFVAYVLDRYIQYDVIEQMHPDGSISSSSSSMFIPLDTLVIVFFFIWLIGIVFILWKSSSATSSPQGSTPVRIESKEQLQKTIMRRYQVGFTSSVLLYSVILGLLAAMVFIISKSRIWYDTDPFYSLLKFFKDLSPFAVIALWFGGVAYLLYRQWRQSASDVVGLIGSIEDMQARQDGLQIGVPDSLPEVRPIIQELYDKGQENRRIAKEAEQRKNELIAYLAHDLRTPLTSIIGYLSLLTEQPEMPTEQKTEYSQIALDKAVRLESLIGQFFEISRYNMSEMNLKKEKLDLKYLLFQLADEFYPILDSQGKNIDLVLQDDLWVYGDADKLARVFNNIIRNAAAYSYPESPVQIAATQNESNIVVTVANRGKTIPEESLQHIFNKFFRADDARGSDTGGAGLGLAIAREIVLLHGGTIEATSADEQTAFTVSLSKYKD